MCARLLLAAVATFLALTSCHPALAQSKRLIAPPRDIADISAILDAIKPDPAAVAALKSKADAVPPAGAGGTFYYGRAQARAELGRNAEAIADALKAITFGGEYGDVVSRYEQFLARQYRAIGEHTRALEVKTRMARNFEAGSSQFRGRLFTTYRTIAASHLSLGNPDKAAAAVARIRALLNEVRPWTSWSSFGTSWQSTVEDAQALLFESRGQYREAELAYASALTHSKDAMVKSLQWPSASPRADWYRTQNFLRASSGRMKAKQGRLVDGENDIRLALRDQLRTIGKYHASTAGLIRYLAEALLDQGRLADGETLARAALEIVTQAGLHPESSHAVQSVALLANILELRQQHAEAAKLFADLDVRIQNWIPSSRLPYQLSEGRIFTLYALGKVAEGIDLARSSVANSAKSYGANHLNTAYARGILAIGLAHTGRDKEALAEFRFAAPLLATSGRETSDDDTATVANRDIQVQRILEPYIELLAKTGGAPEDIAAETFSLGETMRSRSVQRAITAAAARIAQPNDALNKVVRSEQDLDKQIKANTVLLSRLLTQASEGRDEKAIQAQTTLIEKLKGEHRALRREIERSQPRYADLVEPKPPTARAVADRLLPSEALLSFFFGRQNSFVWVLRKGSPAVVAALSTSIQEVDARVRKLREALEPPDGEPIPPFDVAGAAELYELLLKPVEQHLQGSRSLLIVTNGSLALLPLGLLPTARVELAPGSQPLFAEYRNVPWLARTHAVSFVPSAAALLTIRGVAPGASDREMLIGFGDPKFSAAQSADTAVAVAPVDTSDTRGVVVRRRALPSTRNLNTANLGSLAPLPDTALELQAIAKTLRVDPTKALHLGVNANERVVKTTNLARYKVVAFSTHGLLPNDLDGLTEPALALTAPDIAGVDGDGLLTMEEVLSLKLDADWVVLSACNTAAGTSADAEAASGLGRAFFYAGARALLVTNWAVDSASARDLVTGLFDRYVNTPGVSRSEALRQTMMHLVDNGALTDESGRVLWTYAHPFFWAPYSVVSGGT